MVIGSAQNGYVREALKLAQMIQDTLIDAQDNQTIQNEPRELIQTDLNRLKDQLEKAVKYGRDLFQEAG